MEKHTQRSSILRVLIIFSIIVGLPAYAQQKLNSSDFVVAGISRGMSKINVKKILGKPKNEEMSKGVTENFTSLKYAGLIVDLGSDQEVFGVEITSAKYATARGLRVGDSDKKLLELYGNPESKYQQDWDYNFDDEKGLLRVGIKKNKVDRIYIGSLDD